VTTSHLTRAAGWLLIGSFVLCLIGGMTHPIVAGNAHSAESLTATASPYAQYLLLAGTVGLLIGLPILYSHFADQLGRLGLVGTLLYLVGNATCAMAHLVVEAMVAVPLAADAATRGLIPADGSLFASTGFQLTQMVGGPVLLLGQILLGVAVIRSRSLPRWPGVLLIVGGVLALVPLPEIAVLAGVLFELPRGLAVAALGWIMISQSRPARTKAPVTEHQPA
jgi:hypothetical protein